MKLAEESDSEEWLAGNSGANDASGSRVKLHNTDEEELKKAAAVMTSVTCTRVC